MLHSQDRNSNKNGDKDESQTELMLETEIMSGTTSVESTVLMNNETELMADTTATSLLEQSYDKQKTRDFLQSGDILDSRYELLKVIGVGGQGTVYLARDTKLGTNCAVKAIKLNKNSSVNLLAEPEILKQIRHSSLPRISDIIRQQDYLYVVEEYYEGKSLQELINNKEFCSEANVIKWAKELAEILRYLHSIKPNPIIYRDMKPGNIIIDNEGSVRLIDFGIAREYKVGQESDTTYIGTRGYAAPEQYGTNQSDERTDIYSLGVTLYHVVTGKGPHDPPYEILPIRQVNPHLSEGLELIIQKCVKTDPRQRFQSAQELLETLENIHKLNKEYRMARLKRRVAVLAVIMALFLSGFGITQYIEHKEMEKQVLYNQYVKEGIQELEAKNYVGAEQVFVKAMALDPKEEIYLNMAKVYLAQNLNDKVIEYLTDETNKGNLINNAKVKYVLGSAYFNLKDYRKAIWHFSAAAKDGEQVLGADYVTAYRDLAVSYGRAGDYQNAQYILDDLTNNKKVDEDISHYIKGELFQIQQNYDQARQEFETASRLQPNNNRYKLSLAHLYLAINNPGLSYAEKNENYSKAIALLNEVEELEAYNDLGKVYYDYGLLNESQGTSGRAMFQQSLINFNKIIDLGIEDISVLINIGILQEKLGNLAQADNSYMKALIIDENDSRANLVYGLFKLKQKQYNAAYNYLNKTVELNQNAAEVATARDKINELRAKGWIN